MNNIPPLGRQIMVASGPILAASTIGGLLGYFSVLIEQLNSKDSPIELDLDSSTWLVSVYSFMGVPSIFVPALMHNRGRKIGFITCAVSIVFGSVLIHFAQNVTVLLIGESFIGFGWNSVIPVSLIIISEMVDPSIRSITMLLFGVSKSLSIVTIMILGHFLHWRTLIIILNIPIMLSFMFIIFWPESPYWLACKGKFENCERSFTILRGTGVEAKEELADLIKAQKECKRKKDMEENQSLIQSVLTQIRKRDFYMPMLHDFILLNCFFFGGSFVILINGPKLIEKVTKYESSMSLVYVGCTMGVAGILSIFVGKFLKNKQTLIASFLASAVTLLFGCVVLFLRDTDILPPELIFASILGYLLFNGMGVTAIVYNIVTELLPVKHRGIGGAMLIVIISLSSAISQKIGPYMFVSIDESGTLLFYAIISVMGATFVWKFIPETKGRPLQDIEDYYNVGHFAEKVRLENVEERVPFNTSHT